VLDVAAPIGKGLAEQLSSLAHAFRPIRRTRQWRVVVDELWVEIPIDGGWVTLVNKALMNSSTSCLF
jgi:hypothetical protein